MRIIFAYHFITPVFTYNKIVPLGILSLATILFENGYDVQLLDLASLSEAQESKEINAGTSFEHMADTILSKSPDVVGFTTMCGSFHDVLMLSDIIKAKNPKIKIILGGPQASEVACEVLERFPAVDLICVGEAESIILDIIEGIKRQQLRDIPGIAYRNGASIVKNASAALIQELDSLPMPNYHLVPNAQNLSFSMEISRGCPYRCVFCATSKFWQAKFRLKSIGRICREIASIQSFSLRKPANIDFIDDNFTTNYAFTHQLCAEIQKMGITWSCDARADTLDESLIGHMARSGCGSILMGIETASPRMQKIINKNLDIEKVKKVIECLLLYNIKPVVSFMYGFPEETESDLIMTLDMIVSLVKKGGVKCTLHSLSVLAGTKLDRDHREKLIFTGFHSDFSDASNLTICSSLIKENRDLFPHFYTLKGSLGEKYPLLDKFMNYIYIRHYPFFTRTFDHVLNRLDGNFLAFYQDFVTYVREFEEFFRNRDNIQNARRDSTLSQQLMGFFSMYLRIKSGPDFGFRMALYEFSGEKKILKSGIHGSETAKCV